MLGTEIVSLEEHWNVTQEILEDVRGMPSRNVINKQTLSG
jgi:hypothetical protein